MDVYRSDGFIQAQTPGIRDVLVFEENAKGDDKAEGVAHFGFRLTDPKDIEAAVAAVESAGGKMSSQGEFCPGEPFVFFSDPDGYEVEIWYELPTAVDPPVTARASSGANDVVPNAAPDSADALRELGHSFAHAPAATGSFASV